MGESPAASSGNPPEKKAPVDAPSRTDQSSASAGSVSRPDVIKEKFLTVAKEKNQLETVILEQSDLIKKLETDRTDLQTSLQRLTESHKQMKEKLLDFDILRNMEISDLKKKIRQLLDDNKKLTAEKELIYSNLDRDRENISRLDGQTSQSLQQEKAALETALLQAREEISRLSQESSAPPAASSPDAPLPAAVAEDVALLSGQLREAELERDEARAMIYEARAENDRLHAEKADAEKELRQKIAEYGKEISALKIDIDELTSAIEKKIHYIDEMQAKVARLSEELSHRDTELHEKIPALIDKINSLSQSIDAKMEENSLFAKELFDLNVKISSLNEELIRKDELLIEITEDYRKQRDEIASIEDSHEMTIRSLTEQNDLLQQELGMLKDSGAADAEMRAKAAEACRIADEKSKENALIAAALTDRDAEIAWIRQEMDQLKEDLAAREKELLAETTALRDQTRILNRQLLDKNELLTASASDHEHQLSLRDQEIARLKQAAETQASLQAEVVSLRDQARILSHQLLDKNELLTASASDHEHQLSLRDQEIARLKQDLQDLHTALSLHQARADAASNDAGLLAEQLQVATEKLQDLAGEQARLALLTAEKDRALQDALQEGAQLRTAMDALRESGESGSGQPTTHSQPAEDPDRYRETFEPLKEEIISLSRALAEKERIIEALIAEKDTLARTGSGYQAEIDRSYSMIRELTSRLGSMIDAEQQAAADRRDLSAALSELKGEMKSLRQGKEDQISELQKDLSAYAEALASLRQRLEQSIQDNAALYVRLQNAPAAADMLKEETLPVYIAAPEQELKPRHRSRLTTALLLMLLAAALAGAFTVYQSGMLRIADHETAQQPAPRRELSYPELFSLLSRTDSADPRFQAILITAPLMLKSDDAGENARYDFQKYLYFKVTVSSPGGLAGKLLKDPASIVTLSAGGPAEHPLAGAAVKEGKLFYRKELPVSATFYVAFPVTILSEGSTRLTLSLAKSGGPATLSWDLAPLRQNSLIP